MDSTDKAVESNVGKVFWARSFLHSWVTIPTLALFYLDRGLSLSDLILLKTILSVVALCLEIPSGYMADVLGRKNTAVLGCIVWLCSLLIYIFGMGLFAFACAEVCLGVAASLLSGVDSALVFDSLKQVNKEEKYMSAETRMSSASGVSEAVGGLLGAFLAGFNLLYPFYLQFCLVLGALFLFSRTVEPRRERLQGDASHWKGITAAVRYALVQHKGLQSIILFNGISASGTLLLVWLAQGYMVAIDIPVAYFGVAWAVFHIALAWGALLASYFVRRLGPDKLIAFMAYYTCLAFFIMSIWQSYVGLLCIFALYIIRGLRTPFLRTVVNAEVSSEVRATILSVQAFVMRFFAIIAGPILAVILEQHSLAAALYVVGVGSAVSFSIAIGMIRRSLVLGV